ncbi:hypothetical protein IXO812_20665, partial [Xanthomonas oryzae pv. oryzae]
MRDPCLPEFLNDVVLRDLRLGASSVDLRLRRHGDEVSLEVLRTRGQIHHSAVLRSIGERELFAHHASGDMRRLVARIPILYAVHPHHVGRESFPLNAALTVSGLQLAPY